MEKGLGAASREISANKCQPPPGSVAKPCYQHPPIIGIDVASDKQLAASSSLCFHQPKKWLTLTRICMHASTFDPTSTCDFEEKSKDRNWTDPLFERERCSWKLMKRENCLFTGKNKDAWIFKGRRNKWSNLRMVEIYTVTRARDIIQGIRELVALHTLNNYELTSEFD